MLKVSSCSHLPKTPRPINAENESLPIAYLLDNVFALGQVLIEYRIVYALDVFQCLGEHFAFIASFMQLNPRENLLCILYDHFLIYPVLLIIHVGLHKMRMLCVWWHVQCSITTKFLTDLLLHPGLLNHFVVFISCGHYKGVEKSVMDTNNSASCIISIIYPCSFYIWHYLSNVKSETNMVTYRRWR